MNEIHMDMKERDLDESVEKVRARIRDRTLSVEQGLKILGDAWRVIENNLAVLRQNPEDSVDSLYSVTCENPDCEFSPSCESCRERTGKRTEFFE